MGCSAGKNPSLDRIPSTSSSNDQKIRENGKAAYSTGNTIHSDQQPSKKNIERRDTGPFSESLVNGNQGDQIKSHQGTSLIDLSSTKKHKEIPLSGPLCNNNKEISKSQSDFFKMLDEKIEKGKQCDEERVT